MGRPIKSKYFLHAGSQTPSDVVKYNGVDSISVTTGSHYSQGATVTVANPDWVDGITASVALTVALPGAGGGISAAITNQGEGYASAPQITIHKPASVTVSSVLSTVTSTISGITTTGIYIGMKMDGAPGMPASNYVTAVGASSVTGTYHFTANTTTDVTFSDQGNSGAIVAVLGQNQLIPGTIAATAYLTTGSSAVASTIIKQQSSRGYLVENGQGRGRVKLVTSSTAAMTPGSMTIVATDVGGASYFVKKLTSRRAVLVSRTNTGTALVTLTDDGTVKVGSAGWTLSAAYTGTNGPVVSISVNSI